MMVLLVWTSTQPSPPTHTRLFASTNTLQATKKVENIGNLKDVAGGDKSPSQKLAHLIDWTEMEILPQPLVTMEELWTTSSVTISNYLEIAFIIALIPVAGPVHS